MQVKKHEWEAIRATTPCVVSEEHKSNSIERTLTLSNISIASLGKVPVKQTKNIREKVRDY